MSVYLLTFFTSFFLFKFSEKQKNKLLSIILISIAIGLPCLLAGFRELNVGTDVLNYVKPLSDLASQSDNFSEFLQLPIYRTWRYVSVNSIEIGYLFITYIVTKLFDSIVILNIVFSLIICLCIYMGLVCMKKKLQGLSVSFGMLVFYLLFYNASLNTVRQWVALSILFFGFHYIFEKKIFKYMITVLVAISFHKTAILGLLLYIIYELLQTKGKIVYSKDKKYFKIKNIIFLVIVVLLSLIVINPKIFNSIFSIMGLSKYVDVYLSGSFKFSYSYFLLSLPILIIIFMKFKDLMSGKVTMFLTMIYICFSFLAQLSSYSPYAIRIADMFGIYNVYSFSVFSYSKNNKMKTIIYRFVLIVYMLLYWYIFYVILDSGQTIPYNVIGR